MVYGFGCPFFVKVACSWGATDGECGLDPSESGCVDRSYIVCGTVEASSRQRNEPDPDSDNGMQSETADMKESSR